MNETDTTDRTLVNILDNAVKFSNPGSPIALRARAEAGRQITIIGQNAHSTIVHNARIRLRGGANFTTSAGSSLTLLHTGEYWQEIARSQ